MSQAGSLLSFRFQKRHLLVIAVLVMAFSMAMILRSYPIKYGFYLNEFDPYFDYRATRYIVENGLDAYWNWHDEMSWYPEGRDIAATSQSGLHVTAAIAYFIFGAGSPLLDFTIMFPVVIGSLTVIAVFALVRVIGGTTAGLFSAIMFALSPPVILRGNLGWFKSEPLGLFFGILAIYLFISAIKHKELKYAIAKAILGGLLLGLANASWGGVQYFSIPISLFFLAIPFFRRDTTIPMYVAIAFTVFTLVAAAGFPRPGLSFVAGLPGIAMMGSTAFLVAANLARRFSKSQTRSTTILLVAFIAAGIGLIVAGAYVSPSFRYLNAVNPFIKSQNPLVESVAEHLTPTVVDYFSNYSVLLLLAGFGAWMAFSRRHDTGVFVLILGLTSLYVSATFGRLLVFASLGIIALAGIGFYEVTKSLMHRNSKVWTKAAYAGLMISLLMVPILLPNSSWIVAADVPPAISNGGTPFLATTRDWIDAMDWISKNTEKDAVIAAWWDYGYWITTLGQRTTLADNATLNQTRIEDIAKMFTSDEQSGIKIAQDLKADYILVYVVGQRLAADESSPPVFALGQGGEESKKQWIMRIAGASESRFLEPDGFTPKQEFWSSTLLGRLVPYEPAFYASFGPDGLARTSPVYQPGFVELYSKHVKYPADGQADQPLHLVYSSPSFNNDEDIVFGVLVYKVNHDYVPKPETAKLAEVTTTQGTFTIEFFSDVAPAHVDNFVNLASAGYYDGIVFHRIVPDFVVQAGDPQTRDPKSDRSTWGTGGPGYFLAAEFNDIPHSRGIVSMARGSAPDSAGSQFFIVLKDSSQIQAALDGQYTVFGRVVDGMDVVDKIARLRTVGGQGNDWQQPVNPDDARILSIRIADR